MPRGAKLAGEPIDDGMLSAQLTRRPVHDTSSGGVPRRSERRELLYERRVLAYPAGAAKPTLAPNDRCGPAERGDVDQAHDRPTMPGFDHAADRARVGLDGYL